MSTTAMANAAACLPHSFRSLSNRYHSCPSARLSRSRASRRDGTLSSSSSSSSASPSSDREATLDVSVFRFTLGIPGFDDSDLPRAIGFSFGAILLLNHLLTTNVVLAAQWRSEFVGFCNAIFSIVLPSIGRILNGGPSKETATAMSTCRQIFALARDLSEVAKEDLAWGSYALLKNTNTTSLAIWYGEFLCARGLWDIPAGVEGDPLQWLQRMLRSTALLDNDRQFYLPRNADKQGWSVIPLGAVCALVVPFNASSLVDHQKGGIILLSSVPNAYSSKDRVWITLLMQKIMASFVENNR